jgi:hypothetical protein
LLIRQGQSAANDSALWLAELRKTSDYMRFRILLAQGQSPQAECIHTKSE